MENDVKDIFPEHLCGDLPRLGGRVMRRGSYLPPPFVIIYNYLRLPASLPPSPLNSTFVAATPPLVRVGGVREIVSLGLGLKAGHSSSPFPLGVIHRLHQHHLRPSVRPQPTTVCLFPPCCLTVHELGSGVGGGGGGGRFFFSVRVRPRSYYWLGGWLASGGRKSVIQLGAAAGLSSGCSTPRNPATTHYSKARGWNAHCPGKCYSSHKF